MIPKPRYSTFNQNKLQNLFPFEKQEKKSLQNIEQKRNSSTFLNQTLIGLNNQFIRRTNTDQNPLKGSIFQLRKNEKIQLYTQLENNFMFEPWNDNSQIFQPHTKTPLTQIRSNKQKTQSIKKSFLITQVPNKVYKHNSSTSYEGTKKNSHTLKNLNRMSNSKVYNLSFQQETDSLQQMKQKNYNYSNEQKVKISLDYIVQKKKHSKMSNLLKMKTHTFDKTLMRQQNASYQSKNLIEALERLPNDKKLQKSIDRAVEVLKKRTHHSLQSNNSISPKKKLSETNLIVEQTSKNCLSCRKIGLQKSDIQATNQLKSYSLIKDFYLNQNLQTKPQNCIAMKQKCKISFKPKRNYLISRKASKSMTKKLPNKQKNIKEKSQESVKKKFSLGVLLQVNHLTQ